jgi:uncharacterized membrane protein (UPF0127 family)
MQAAERITLLLITLLLVGGVGWLVWVSQTAPVPSPAENVATTSQQPTAVEYAVDERRYFPNPVTFTIGSTTWRASVAATLPARIQGLSNTPFLPMDMVKWFDFQSYGPHSIWMKDMQYPLDIVWLDREGVVVHIEERVSPETFPDSFSSPTPAWYVLEGNVGFVASSSLAIGSVIVPPQY